MTRTIMWKKYSGCERDTRKERGTERAVIVNVLNDHSVANCSVLNVNGIDAAYKKRSMCVNSEKTLRMWAHWKRDRAARKAGLIRRLLFLCLSNIKQANIT